MTSVILSLNNLNNLIYCLKCMICDWAGLALYEFKSYLLVMTNHVFLIRGFHQTVFRHLWRLWTSDCLNPNLFKSIPFYSLLTLLLLFRVRSLPDRTSRSVAVTWPTLTTTTLERPGRSGASVPTPTDPIYWWTSQRECSIWTRSRTPLSLASSGLPKR